MGGLIQPIMATGSGTVVSYQDTSSAPDGGDSSGWLSGLGDLFQGIGAGIGSGIQASNLPKVPTAGSGWVFNAATGTYVNPITGQALTATGAVPSLGSLGSGLTSLTSNPILLIGLIVVGFLLLRKKE